MVLTRDSDLTLRIPATIMAIGNKQQMVVLTKYDAAERISHINPRMRRWN